MLEVMNLSCNCAAEDLHLSFVCAHVVCSREYVSYLVPQVDQVMEPVDQSPTRLAEELPQPIQALEIGMQDQAKQIAQQAQTIEKMKVYCTLLFLHLVLHYCVCNWFFAIGFSTVLLH